MTVTIINPPGLGVEPDDKWAVVTARNGNICAGYCYPFSLLGSGHITADGVAISTIPGNVGFPYANVSGGSGANASDMRGGRFCIALEDIADGLQGRVKVKGLVQAYVMNSEASPTAVNFGQELVVVGASGSHPASLLDGNVANSTGAPRKGVGYAFAAHTTAISSGALMTVDFDGYDGIGFTGNL